MTCAKGIELAMAETILNKCDIGEDTKIRAFRSMNFDGSWDSSIDRELPFIGVRSSPAMTDDNQSTEYVDVYIDIATNAMDDKSHEQISTIEESIRLLLEKLYKQFRNGQTTAEEYAYFSTKVTEYVDALTDSEQLSFTWGDGNPPVEDSGMNLISQVFRIHYGRTDY